MKLGETRGWRAVSEWRDGPGEYGMTQVWSIDGPAPFGGLTAATEGQAQDAADMLNRLYDREPPLEQKPEPAPDPTATGLAAAISADHGLSVTVRGMSITVTGGEQPATLGERILAEFITAKSVRTRSQLYDRVKPDRIAHLDEALTRLSESGALRRTYLVRSPFDNVLDEFDSMAEVPDSMTDDFIEPPRDFDVGAGDIEIRYQRGSKS